jgi:hypothetical protein
MRGTAEVLLTDANSFFDEIVSEHGLEGCRDVFWNLGQVIAWVETRSPFHVDGLSDSTPELTRRDHSMPAGLPQLVTEVADRLSSFKSHNDVRSAVLRSFQSGLLTASGQRRGSFDREPITPLEWADLNMDYNLSGGVTLRHRDGFVEAWNHVRVKGDDVRAAFPMLGAGPNARSPGPKQKYDWVEGKQYAVKLFAERGDFESEPNQVHGWKSQTDLVKLVQAHLKEDDARARDVPEGNEPGLSTTKGYVAKWLAEWRGQQ